MDPIDSKYNTGRLCLLSINQTYLSLIPDVGGMIHEPPMRWVCIVIVDVPEEEV